MQKVYTSSMKLSQLFEAWRYHGHMTIKEAAEQIGIPWDTYRRMEKGERVSMETFARILKWMIEG